MRLNTTEIPDLPGWTYLRLGAYVAADEGPFELRVRRPSYDVPIVVDQVTRRGGPARSRRLPDGLVTGFGGLPRFFQVSLVNASGRTTLNLLQDFCPNSEEAARVRPDAPGHSAYPHACSTNPFTVANVWGVEAGWATPAIGPFGYPLVNIQEGTYTARVSITKPYRDLWGIPADQASVSVRVVVGHAGAAGVARDSSAARAAAGRPAGAARVPSGLKPDLRSLPAYGIEVRKSSGRDRLTFAATVWNAGAAPLVVDGFRRPDEDVMDTYQYFYDKHGNQVGFVPAGTMEWDTRDGHNHWHLTGFASYQLLDAGQSEVVASEKQGFCLASTDPINHLVRNANWQPDNADLHTACGTRQSLAVRQVLHVGTGDTYVQTLPGQSFDITDLPNGTYYVRVHANPDGVLVEADHGNNVSLRRLILGGMPGARTVTVPPYGVVTA